jgi:hypothetical protein
MVYRLRFTIREAGLIPRSWFLVPGSWLKRGTKKKGELRSGAGRWEGFHAAMIAEKTAGVVALRLMRWLRLIGWLRWEGLRGEKSENRVFFLFWVEKGF